MANIDAAYQSILKDLLNKGSREVNQRTGHETASLPGVVYSTDISKEGLPILSIRKIPVRIFVAEQIWFISGSRKPDDFLREYTKIWDDFTNPGDVVTVAYGYRWRKHFGRDQLGKLIALLQKDPSSRHGVVVTWDPSSDGLGGVSKGNVPCPYTFTVNIIDGKLNMVNVVRSNDMILGFPHDVAGFSLLQAILAQKLGVEPGEYTHVISNAHIYDIHYDAASEIINRMPSQSKIDLVLPPDSYDRAEKKDHDLTASIIDEINAQYTPQPAIKGLKIVL